MRPRTTADVAPAVVAKAPPGEAVTVYPVIALPPSDGAVQETIASVLPGVALTAVGASGTVGAAAGVTFRALNPDDK